MYTPKLYKAYLKIVTNPSPELKKEFDAELGFLGNYITFDTKIVELGCGNARVLKGLWKAGEFGSSVGIDNYEPAILDAYKKTYSNLKINFVGWDVLNIPKSARDMAHLVFSNYNLIGSFEGQDRQKLVNNMASMCRTGRRVINITWNDKSKTTEFIKQHHIGAGMKVLYIDNTKTVTDQGTFYRVSNEELDSLYKNAGLEKRIVYQVGNIWKAIVGVKL